MSGKDEMTCRELVELVTDYLDEELPEETRKRFEDHLEECPYCDNYLDQMRQTIRVLGRVTEASISAKARDDLLEAFRGWKAAS